MVHHIERGFGQQSPDNNEPITDQFPVVPVVRHIDHDTQQTETFQVPQQYRQDYPQPRTNQPSEMTATSKSIQEKKKKLSIKVGAGLMAIAAASGLSFGIVKANSEEEVGYSTSVSSAEQDAFQLEYQMDKDTDAEFLARPLAERLSYGQAYYNRSAEIYYNKTNTALTRENETSGRDLHVLEGGVPVLSRTSTAREIMDFQAVANALRTGGDKGSKVGSLYIDDANLAAAERMNQDDAKNPDTISLNTFDIFSDSGYYEKNGSTYIDITFSNPLRDNEPVESTFKQEVFTSVLDGKEYVTARIMAEGNEF